MRCGSRLRRSRALSAEQRSAYIDLQCFPAIGFHLSSIVLCTSEARSRKQCLYLGTCSLSLSSCWVYPLSLSLHKELALSPRTHRSQLTAPPTSQPSTFPSTKPSRQPLFQPQRGLVVAAWSTSQPPNTWYINEPQQHGGGVAGLISVVYLQMA